ncbi:sialidase-3-like [Engraulis encrasicolus]|uniref:sialidase-3-like n=1 Tax=Engraulis encrasicolus TaxID=184585 RepID=UPI002FD09D04
MGNNSSNSKTTRIHPPETPIFAAKDYDFRIPALLYVREWSTFLAFAEKRRTWRDETAKDLVMRTGTRQTDGTLQWSPMKILKEATKEGYRTMNPCPVFERKSETLFLFFICLKCGIQEWALIPGQSRLCYVTSGDCGETWSDPKDLTNILTNKFSNCKTFALGPGHGIQLSGELSGSLLIPAYVKVYEGIWLRNRSVVIRNQNPLTPDTWQVGEPLTMKTGECQLAEVCNREGRRQVYMNARSAGEFRLEALSDDGGISFTLLPELTLKERPNGCQGSVLAFPARELPAGVEEGGQEGSQETAGQGEGGQEGSQETAGVEEGGQEGSQETAGVEEGGQEGSQETALLFSHPTAGEGYHRKDLGLYVSKSLQDQPPWGKPSIIHPGTSGYSDLTHCEKEGQFACLMECGGGERLQIVFREFDLHSPSGAMPKAP